MFVWLTLVGELRRSGAGDRDGPLTCRQLLRWCLQSRTHWLSRGVISSVRQVDLWKEACLPDHLREMWEGRWSHGFSIEGEIPKYVLDLTQVVRIEMHYLYSFGPVWQAVLGYVLLDNNLTGELTETCKISDICRAELLWLLAIRYAICCDNRHVRELKTLVNIHCSTRSRTLQPKTALWVEATQ